MENESPDAPDALDSVISAALAQYANVEPLTGLEQRVLERVRAGRSWGRYAWWGLPVAAGLAMLAVLWPGTAPQKLTLQVRVPPPPRIAYVPEVAPLPIRRVVSALPKRRVFPTPTPPTSQERALLALAIESPDVARDLYRRNEQPVRIEEIKIAPLESAESK